MGVFKNGNKLLPCEFQNGQPHFKTALELPNVGSALHLPQMDKALRALLPTHNQPVLGNVQGHHRLPVPLINFLLVGVLVVNDYVALVGVNYVLHFDFLLQGEILEDAEFVYFAEVGAQDSLQFQVLILFLVLLVILFFNQLVDLLQVRTFVRPLQVFWDFQFDLLVWVL